MGDRRPVFAHVGVHGRRDRHRLGRFPVQAREGQARRHDRHVRVPGCDRPDRYGPRRPGVQPHRVGLLRALRHGQVAGRCGDAPPVIVPRRRLHGHRAHIVGAVIPPRHCVGDPRLVVQRVAVLCRRDRHRLLRIPVRVGEGERGRLEGDVAVARLRGRHRDRTGRLRIELHRVAPVTALFEYELHRRHGHTARVVVHDPHRRRDHRRGRIPLPVRGRRGRHRDRLVTFVEPVIDRRDGDLRRGLEGFVVIVWPADIDRGRVGSEIGGRSRARSCRQHHRILRRFEAAERRRHLHHRRAAALGDFRAVHGQHERRAALLGIEHPHRKAAAHAAVVAAGSRVADRVGIVGRVAVRARAQRHCPRRLPVRRREGQRLRGREIRIRRVRGRRDGEPARPGHGHRHRPRRLRGQRDRVAGVGRSVRKPFHQDQRRGRECDTARIVVLDDERHIRRVPGHARRRQLDVCRRPRNCHLLVRRIDVVGIGVDGHRAGTRRQAGRDRELRAGLREVGGGSSSAMVNTTSTGVFAS